MTFDDETVLFDVDGTLIDSNGAHANAWTQALQHHGFCVRIEDVAKLLQQTLEEEKAADKKLSSLAESGINQRAADAAHPGEEQEPVGAGASAGRKGASVAKAGRR